MVSDNAVRNMKFILFFFLISVKIEKNKLHSSDGTPEHNLGEGSRWHLPT